MEGQSESIWYDEIKNEYLKIDNMTGESQKVYKTGDYIKEFDASLTGQVDYKERMMKAGDRKQYYPHQPKSLQHDSKSTYYNPQNEKLIGYSQFPNPRCEPYFNQRHSIRNFNKDKKLITMIDQVKNNYSPFQHHNKSLYRYESNQDTVVSYLTGTRNDLQNSLKNSQIEVLKKTQHIHSQDYQKGTIKIINDQKLPEPNLALYTRKKKSFDIQSRTKAKKLKDYNLVQNQFIKTLDLNEVNTIDQDQFTIRDSMKQSLNVQSVDNLDEYNNYIGQQKQFETTRVKNQFDALQSINSKTYENTLQEVDLDTMFSKQQVKTSKDYKQILQREQQELDCFQIPQQNQAKKISTKNRFNSQIPSTMDQYRKDRMLNKLVDPDLYKVKEVKKKRIFIDPLTGKNIM